MVKSRDFLSMCGNLASKTVVLTGARQLMERFERAQVLNWDGPVNRAVLLRQSWNPAATLLVFDEIHKMPAWKSWLKCLAPPRDQHITGVLRVAAATGG
jgi:superfamily II DNA or RNA helicase